MAAIVLITMPWDSLDTPSIPLGIIHQLLQDDGHDVLTMSLNLQWMEHLLKEQRRFEPPISLSDYQAFGHDGAGLGDFVFANPPITKKKQIAAYYRMLSKTLRPAGVVKVRKVRRLAKTFLEQSVVQVLAQKPRVVGFTTTFSQNVASLALAWRLKRAQPSLQIVFGGANCEGPMGAAMHRCFPWIDVVVRGEGEPVALPLFRALVRGEPPPPLPGLCYFHGGAQVVNDNAHSLAPIDSIPVPNYDDYFAQLSACSFQSTIRAAMSIYFESSRGCWWGAKAHCTFCGLNGSNMSFRSKNPQKALDEIVSLAHRYRVLNFKAADNILDHSYFSTLLPALASSGLDIRLFYEVKANLTRASLEALRDARVMRIQPGIETLSTPILTLMRKGVSAFQNVRILKWCAEIGIDVIWNLMYGFPDEPEAEYVRMVELIPALTHLAAPQMTRLEVHRFSPYHNHAERLGIRILGPQRHYELLYDVDAQSCADIAYEFDYETTGARPADTSIAACERAVRRWSKLHADGAALTYRRGPGFVEIRDARKGQSSQTFVDLLLEGHEAQVFLATVDGAQFRRICGETRLSPSAVQRALDALLEEKLLYREGDGYLGLPTSADPSLRRRVQPEAVEDDRPAQLIPASSILPASAKAANRGRKEVTPF